MRVLTVSEFQDWLRRSTPEVYIYSSSNQASRCSARASLHFDRMVVCPEIRQLWFGNGHDSLFFDEVKEVHMFDDVNSVGTVFDVVCEGPSARSYRILAD